MLSEKDKHLLRGLFQHSDFTVAGRNHHKFRRQVDRHLANGGLLTDDVLNSFFIRNNKDVVIALKAYNLFMRPDDVDWEGKQYSSSFMPPDMYYYIIAFLEGEHKSATSNALPATWAVDIDCL
ncbi:MAG: hypothetical protein KUG64_08800, partial [Cycloclasticus sp.]|nr:hypothetical protein [Cycloclasticus sp.]